MKTYRVVIVEDQAMPRQLFELYIGRLENYETVSTFENAGMAAIFCMRNPVDLVLMDVLTKDGSNGLDAAERIKNAPGCEHTKIIIVTSMPEFSWMERARGIGIESFWYKDVSPEPIIDVIERTMAGEHIYPDSPPEVTFGLTTSAELTVRELDVLREMTGGYKNPEIAEHLNISAGTVKSHIQNMLLKTGFRSRTELAVKARECGLVIMDTKEE